uniref:Uncharacterized protein n=1 Tax=Arundo donax TaxID=35708 RepID=A0A0A9B2J2_ARUDO
MTKILSCTRKTGATPSLECACLEWASLQDINVVLSAMVNVRFDIFEICWEVT